MKIFKILLVFAVFFSLAGVANAQKIQIKTMSGKVFTYGDNASLTTTDSLNHVIDSIHLYDNTAGMLEVSVAGLDIASGNAVTGSQIVRYAKKSGTLTLGSPANILAKVTDTSISGATFTIAASGNNVIVQVNGATGKTIRWKCLVKQVFP